MSKKVFFLFVIIFLLTLSNNIYCERVLLKSGQVLNGEVSELENQIKIELRDSGIVLRFSKNEIESIENEPIPTNEINNNDKIPIIDLDASEEENPNKSMEYSNKERNTPIRRNNELIHVKKVIDGNEFFIDSQVRYRLIGVNTPYINNILLHKDEWFGKEALTYTKKLIENKYVIFEYDLTSMDKFSVPLVYVYVQDGSKEVFLNAEIIKQGYGRVCLEYPFTKKNEFINYEEEAKLMKRGLWRGKPTPTLTFTAAPTSTPTPTATFKYSPTVTFTPSPTGTPTPTLTEQQKTEKHYYIDRPFFGVNLGETRESLEKKCKDSGVKFIEDTTTDNDGYPVYSFLINGAVNKNQEIDTSNIIIYKDRVFVIEITFKNATLEKYEIIKQSLDQEYGRWSYRRSPDENDLSINKDFVLSAKIDDKDVDIILIYNTSFFNDELKLLYYHSEICDKANKARIESISNRVKEGL